MSIREKREGEMANIVVVSLEGDAYYAASVVDLLRDCGYYEVMGVTSVSVLSGTLQWADLLVFWDTPIAMLEFSVDKGLYIPILVLVPGEIPNDFRREFFFQSNVYAENMADCVGEELLQKVRELLSA